MKKILSSAVLVLIFTSLSFAQTNYFPNRIIVKYESEENLQKLNANNSPAIQTQVEDYLSSLGLSEISPIWNNGLENQMQSTLSQKRKSIQNRDISADLRRIVEYIYTSDMDPMMLARKLSNMPGVEYAEPRFIFQTTLAPNDPFPGTFQSVHKFEEAWEVTTGSSDVIIGIVDSGVNYRHQDLRNKAWINEDEIPDNGIDDDENGFIDDHIGWDFWDSGAFFTDQMTADNDPFAEFSDHGTHVAGIATAEADNSLGLAGSGYHSRYMAIKAGGIEDDPNTENDESRSIGFGYDGIIYGVTNGADVINNSWGGSLPGNTEFIQDVINFALDAGVVIISSQGNASTSSPQQPASLDGVLGVGSLRANTEISGFSNYGYTVDVFATGSDIRSTTGIDTADYGFKSGTSMSSPVVAGLAGLLVAQNPDWSPRRIIHQIRSTSIPFSSTIDPLLLGKGMIDAEAAVTTPMPGIDVRSINITDSEGTSLSVGESGIAEVSITNYGEATGNLIVSFEVQQEEIIITSDPVSIGVLGTDESTTVEVEFDIPSNYDLNNPPTFVIRFDDDATSYIDFGVFEFDNLNFGVMDVNNVTMSFGANGTIGFSDPASATGGIGFIPEGFSNIMYEAGIIMMAGGSDNPFEPEEPQLSNNVRGISFYDSDFDPGVPFAVNNPGENAQAEGTGTFKPNRFSEIKRITVRLNAFAFEDANVENAVYTQYLIKNNSDEPIEDFYLGVFTDWDVNDFGQNIVGFDSDNQYIYIFDQSEGNNYPYIAVDAMQSTSSLLAIDNDHPANSETEYQFRLYDGYSDDEKRRSMVAGNRVTTSRATDVSSVVASGPYTIGPGVTVKLGFIYVYGADGNDLSNKILAARDNFVFDVDEPGVYTSSELDSELPMVTNLDQNYPNPFNPSTEINFQLAEAGFTELSIYNILGQKVQTLVNEVKAVGSHSINFDASRLNSGIYFAVLKSGDFTQSIKMTLIK